MFRTALRQLTRIGAAARLLNRPRSPREHDERRAFVVSAANSAAELPVVPRDRRIATMELVTAALYEARVDYRTEVTDSHAYCAVNASDLGAACQALNRLAKALGPRDVHAWFGSGMDYDKFRDATLLQYADVAACESLVVGLPFGCDAFRVLRDGGVEILILDKEGDRRVARRKRAGVVDWTSQFELAAAAGESQNAAIGSAHARHHSLAGEPIDVVYTWVDADDPDWARSMQEWAGRQAAGLESADNVQRYICRDELRYSLRSIWLYAPFVRRVFLVTAGHLPAWLDQNNEKIRVIRHDEIFPDADCLPTFNSHAIESCLHRIPDLAENFIYFNDDVILNREATIGTFFTRMGMAKSRFSQTAAVPVSRPDATSTPTDWATWQSAELVERDFGIRFDRKLKHAPMAMKRSVLGEIESRYGEEIARTRRSRFRAESDIATTSALAHFYGIGTGKAVEWAHVPGEYCYVDTGRSDFEAKLGEVPAVDPVFVCLNATRHADVPMDHQERTLGAFFEARYPLTSPFEKSFERTKGEQ